MFIAKFMQENDYSVNVTFSLFDFRGQRDELKYILLITEPF